jgi:hypothetical protein
MRNEELRTQNGERGNEERCMEPEDRHRACWYSRRTAEIPLNIGFHTIADGELLYCAHPMLFPVVGLAFDVRNCSDCDYFRAARAASPTEPD